MISKMTCTTAIMLLTMVGGSVALGDILVRVDVQQTNNNNGVLTTDELTATTQSSSFGDDGTNFWNAVNKSVGALPTHALKASDAPSGPTVAFFDAPALNVTAGRQSVAEALRHDYFGATNSVPVPWQISGLAPNASYELVLYGGQDPFGSGATVDTRFQLDLNGDTVLDSTTDVSFADAAVYFSSVFADSAGVLRGTFAQISGNDPGTGSWSGLQLAGPRGIPEPTSCVLALFGGVGLTTLSRRRTKRGRIVRPNIAG